MEVPLYITCCFSFVTFNCLHFKFCYFDYIIYWCTPLLVDLFFLILFYLTLKYCIGLAIYQKESDLIWNKYSCLENSIDRGVWQAAVHVVTKQRVGYDWATVSLSFFYFLTLRGGAWCATVHGVTKTWTQSSKWTTNACCCLVTQWCPILQPHALQHPRLPCPSPSHRACSNLCLLTW